MNSPNPNPEERIPVDVLGATGTVGQRMIRMLDQHPWFRINALRASENSAGKKYGEATSWNLPNPIPDSIADMTVQPCEPDGTASLAFSALKRGPAGEVEEQFAENGYAVISNAGDHRMDRNVPLIIPEVNPDHLQLIQAQRHEVGCIITNPNCSTIGLMLPIKALIDKFGVDIVRVATLQALSGAGHPGVPAIDIADNVLPHTGGVLGQREKDKMAEEPRKILGEYTGTAIRKSDIRIQAMCNRVNVTDGHTECAFIELKKNATRADVIAALEEFENPLDDLYLPSSPVKPIHVFSEPDRPQAKLDRNRENGMAVSVGEIEMLHGNEVAMRIVSHNAIRGAAGAAILNAELLVRSGLKKSLS